MATGEELSHLVKAINENASYKVLTKEEYDALLARASQSTEHKNENATSTPSPNEFDGTRPKTKPDYKVSFPPLKLSPIQRFPFLNQSQQQNTSTLPSNPYIPKLPIFSGTEEPQKGETSYEVWNFEVKCLRKSDYLPEHLLLQAIRNSLRGTARSMLVPLGENATVENILDKLDGFFGNVSTSETLIQSFYSDCQKENESVVAYGSRLEQTISRAVACGHIDLVAKDAMLRSKFWTGLKSQALKNSTRHLYDSIKDFQSLLKEIRKVDSEESSSKPSKKQATQQNLSGQVSAEDTNAQLLKQMSELMGRMKKMEEKIEEQNKAISDAKKSSHQESFINNNNYSSRGRGFNRGSWRGNYGRGYQNGNSHNNSQVENSHRGNRGGRFRGGYRGGTSGRGAHRGNTSQGGNSPLNN